MYNYTRCPHCERLYKLGDKKLQIIGQEFACRCGQRFVATAIEGILLKEDIKRACKFNLLSVDYINKESKRDSLPFGVLFEEFMDMVKDHAITKLIRDHINKNRSSWRKLSTKDVEEIIDNFKKNNDR
ncbi:MAG: hypothetical protein OEV73_00160 [Desulfobulbaceae bacterium]|nr:hypothetical protein [Desulfobulbaceae bacterium]